MREIIRDARVESQRSEFYAIDIEGRSAYRWNSDNNYSSDNQPNQWNISTRMGGGNTVAFAPMIRLALASVRRLTGYRPVMLSAELMLARYLSDQAANIKVKAYPVYNEPDIADCNARYRDESELETWTNDTYWPFMGIDVGHPETDFLSETEVPCSQPFTSDRDTLIDITSWYEACLRRNKTHCFVFIERSYNNTPGNETFIWRNLEYNFLSQPALRLRYLFPVEIHPAKDDGTIDLSQTVEAETSQATDLGTYGRSEVSTGKKFFLKNYSRQLQRHLEVWDDFPEWSEPEPDAGNTGTGDLAYVSVFESAVSQKWTVRFLTTNTYEVLGEGYLENDVGEHPTQDADPNWQHDTATDFVAPSGGITIPAAAWSGSPVAGDEIVIFVRGNSSEPGWPADSNDQVEITEDSGGNPDGSRWRPVTGRRTISTGSVTIDSGTKTINVKRIDPTAWPIGGLVAISDSQNIDEGTIQGVTATSVTITGLGITNNVYAAGTRVSTCIPFRSLAAAVWGQLDSDSGASETNPDRLLLDGSAAGFQVGETVFVTSLADPSVNEEGVVAEVTSTYVRLTNPLANDYEAGSFVSQTDTGEVPFWIRVVTTSGTAYELKQLALNVIT